MTLGPALRTQYYVKWLSPMTVVAPSARLIIFIPRSGRPDILQGCGYLTAVGGQPVIGWYPRAAAVS
jgi:hypothetical protein